MAAVQKVALITAGSAGLGAHTARTLASEYRVVINYAHNKERADALVQELSRMPSQHPSPSVPRCLAIQADVSDRAALTGLVDETVRRMGRLDVVVSNHGWTRLTNFLDLDDNVVDEDWDKCFNFNVKSHLYLAHAAKKHLEVSEGAFITTASVAGIKPSGSSVAYAVTKAAQIHLARSLAVVLAPKIRVNSVAPGMLPETEWGQKFSAEKQEKSRQNTKLKRLATVEDCAQMIRTLAANRSMTGQNILLEAGLTL